MLKGQAVKRFGKKAKKGFRGYPMATVAFYAPELLPRYPLSVQATRRAPISV